MASPSSLLLCTLLLALGLSASACGGYGSSCRFIAFTGTSLNLECQRGSGWYFLPTSLDLAYCLEVQGDGTLTCSQWRNPTIAESKCSNIHTAAEFVMDSDTTLTATCENSDGEPVTSTIDLNKCLDNKDGSVKCCLFREANAAYEIA